MADTIHQLEKELKELREENINIKNDNERLRDCVDSCVLNGELDYAELAEAKRLLKIAVPIINNSFPEVGSCWGCANHDEAKDECKGGAFAECSEVCKWEHADKALALIGEDTNVPASKDGDTNG